MLSKQFIRFCFVGLISTILNFIFFTLLFNFHFGIFISSLSGYFIGLLNSLFFGKNYVFKSKNQLGKVLVLKFLFIYLFGALVMSLTLKGLISIGINHFLAWSLALSLSIINNFFGSKFFVFK